MKNVYSYVCGVGDGQKVQPFSLISQSHSKTNVKSVDLASGLFLNGDHICLFLPTTIIIEYIQFKPIKAQF